MAWDVFNVNFSIGVFYFDCMGVRMAMMGMLLGSLFSSLFKNFSIKVLCGCLLLKRVTTLLAIVRGCIA